MKTLIVVCLTILVSAIFTNVYALSVGNFAEPKMIEKGTIVLEDNLISVRGGYQGDFVFDRKLKDLEDAEITTNSGTIILNINKKIDIYTLLGASSGTFKEIYDSIEIEYETDMGFAWGIGAKAILFEYEDTIIGIDCKYFNTEPDLDKIKINGIGYDLPSAEVTKAQIEYDEFQIALGVAQKINMFISYGGIKYSRATGNLIATILGTDYESDTKNKDKIGLFVGCSILPLKNVGLNIEGRFLDETALMISGQIKF